MLLMAFETSAKAGSVALHDGEKLLAQSVCNTGLTHSQTLMVMAEDLLKNTGVIPQDVTAVAVAAGPGSFTGVRIGVAAAKGFAWGADIPLYGVSTLEAMARQMGVYQGYILPVMDARRQQVYNGVFYAEKGVLRRVAEDRAISLQDLGEELKNYKEPIFLVGDGSVLCYNTLKDQISNLILPPEHCMHQQAVGVALAALASDGDGDGCSLTPNYLRLSQAERERLARESK